MITAISQEKEYNVVQFYNPLGQVRHTHSVLGAIIYYVMVLYCVKAFAYITYSRQDGQWDHLGVE